MIALIGVALPLIREGLNMYQVTHHTDDEESGGEVVFKGGHDDCFTFMVEQARSGEKDDGWFTLDKQEKKHEA